MKKREKNVGYILLAIGLSVVLISVVMSFLILMGAVSIPKVITPPSGTGTGTMDEIVKIIANLGDILLAFFLLIVVTYGGGVVMSRGVRLIKEIRLKAVREAIEEISGEEIEVKKKRK